MSLRFHPCLIAVAFLGFACSSEPASTPAAKSTSPQGEKVAAAAPAAATAAAPAPAAPAPRREPLVGGPYPALLVSQAQFG